MTCFWKELINKEQQQQRVFATVLSDPMFNKWPYYREISFQTETRIVLIWRIIRSDSLHTLLSFVYFVFLCFLGSSDVLSVSPMTPGYAEQGRSGAQAALQRSRLVAKNANAKSFPVICYLKSMQPCHSQSWFSMKSHQATPWWSLE